MPSQIPNNNNRNSQSLLPTIAHSKVCYYSLPKRGIDFGSFSIEPMTFSEKTRSGLKDIILGPC